MKRLLLLVCILMVTAGCTPLEEPTFVAEVTPWPTLAALPTVSAQPTIQTTPTPRGTDVLEATPTLSPGIVAEHVVQEGETIEQIADRYAVPADLILQFNDIPNPDSLFIGAILRIPSRGVLDQPVTGPTPFPTLSAELLDNPLWPYSIDNLSRRDYDGGLIVDDAIIATLPDYQIRSVSYVTDNSIRVTARVFVPTTIDPPYPVAVLLHGGFSQDSYRPGDGTDIHAIYFARAGYLTIAPDYQTYNDTEGTGFPLKIPWSIDVLNLLEALPSYSDADASRVGIFGHSRGGGVASYIAVLTPRFPNVKAVGLYNSLSFDQTENWNLYTSPRVAATWPREDAIVIGTPEENPLGYDAVSPINYLSRVEAPMIIHHGELDDLTPLTWSLDLAERLDVLGKPYVLYCYDDAPHRFNEIGADFESLAARNIAFFDYYVRDGQTGTPFESDLCE